MISLIGEMHCNACNLKSNVYKSNFFCGTIATNDKPLLMIIEGKSLEAIVHMIEFALFNLLCFKQDQLLVSIEIHGKFLLSPMLDPCWF
jgi:hypothetical protein